MSRMKPISKRISVLFALVILLSLLSLTAGAATEEPRITMQPQSPCYTEYGVAIYTVKAEGNHLRATWYMEWQGETYSLSAAGSSPQAWEGCAGSSYGAVQPDENTFTFLFEGIGKQLDGAYLWCVLEDGHYDLTSQKIRISVGQEAVPPTIVSIPTELTVGQGEAAEIRCVATAPEGTQLSFLWYETDSGRLEDIRAVNRGEEMTDYLLCDTSVIGTRRYLCQVSSSDGGIVYSSVVPVTVIEKQTAGSQPSTPATDSPQTPTSGTTEHGAGGQQPHTDSLWIYLAVTIGGLVLGGGIAYLFMKWRNKR